MQARSCTLMHAHRQSHVFAGSHADFSFNPSAPNPDPDPDPDPQTEVQGFLHACLMELSESSGCSSESGTKYSSNVCPPSELLGEETSGMCKLFTSVSDKTLKNLRFLFQKVEIVSGNEMQPLIQMRQDADAAT